MKIIVEEGDAFTGLAPGTYEFGAREVRMDSGVDVGPETGFLGRRAIRNSRVVLTLRGELGKHTPPPKDVQEALHVEGGIVRKTLASGRKTSPRMCTDCGASGDRSCSDNCPRVVRLSPAQRAEWDARRKRERERKGGFVANALAEVYSQKAAAEAERILESVTRKQPLGTFREPCAHNFSGMDLGDVVRKVHGKYLAPPRKCDECGGTGEWENPANGRRMPCSRGCPCKS